MENEWICVDIDDEMEINDTQWCMIDNDGEIETKKHYAQKHRPYIRPASAIILRRKRVLMRQLRRHLGAVKTIQAIQAVKTVTPIANTVQATRWTICAIYKYAAFWLPTIGGNSMRKLKIARNNIFRHVSYHYLHNRRTNLKFVQ